VFSVAGPVSHPFLRQLPEAIYPVSDTMPGFSRPSAGMGVRTFNQRENRTAMSEL
jgi:hypothetical protein